MRRLLFALLLSVLASPAGAEAPVLGVPVDCRVGADCFIQNFVDRDPGPGARDYMCGSLSYDGHAGTDFRVGNLAAMRRGVAVLAAAAGRVVRVRDGVDDVSIREAGRERIAGREAGNAVVIDHGDGWETQYSHLRKGSVAVRPGDQVEAGQRLALIGLSGNTEFPHVDFAVRHAGRSVDPFAGPDAAPDACGSGGRTPLWSEAAGRTLAYQPTGVLHAGFAAEPPVDATARDGGYDGLAPGRDAPVLAFWAELFGGQAGDRLELRISGPDGRDLQRSAGTVPKPLAALFLAATASRPAAGWPPGLYRGQLTLTRKGAVAAEAVRRIEIR
jgi:murein DD-endopeptidase MepM/ murein hydrolase activator NlpD